MIFKRNQSVTVGGLTVFKALCKVMPERENCLDDYLASALSCGEPEVTEIAC